MKQATTMTSRDKWERKQQIVAKWECRASHLSACFLGRSLKSGFSSEISQYFSVDSKLTFKKMSTWAK